MKFDFEIRGLGKVKHAKLKLAPFTVIAGTNSSGKSFISRAMYSFFSTINKDHVTAYAMSNLVRSRALLRGAYNATYDPSYAVRDFYHSLNSLFSDLEYEIDSQFNHCTYLEQQTRSVLLDESISTIEDHFQELITEVENKKKYAQFQDRLELSYKTIKILKTNIKNPAKILSDKFETGFKEALKDNFQVANLLDLKSFSSKSDAIIRFNFGSLGEINIEKEDVAFKLTPTGIDEFQSLYNVVFIESPIYWKLRKPLTRAKDYFHNPRFMRNLHRDADALSGVPKYFYDLIELVDQNIKSNSRSEELYELKKELDIVLGGELDITESGDIFFMENESSQNVNINLTATGITNLGLIGLLLKRNVIAKGSFVFVDEPEVNLHPAWQKVMIKILYQLSLNGINVVIASHSIDMMKYIENIMDDYSDVNLSDHFAINRLSPDGVSINECSPRQSMAKIKDDLGTPFYEMFLENGW
ncbi:AAA family ATPase [Shewanella algae]|uniref:AAA family ATPase n=1 Tax=Shewanella algae TaxID=38313 RepID=UPI001AB01732|nr:AAA family ATPase [Shewanella algae]MBO2680806.1 AAA family ATPase [Shewanella algae]